MNVAGLALAAVLALTPAVALAQRPPKVQRVGLLMLTTPAAASHIAAAFTGALRELGHVEGKNVVVEYRWAEGQPERFPALAAELVRLRTDLIIASSTAAAEAARKATTTIPIVMVNAADPVEAGLVRSLARPGGNVTGLSAYLTPEIRAKQLQLLKEALPGLSRVAILRRAAVYADKILKGANPANLPVEYPIQFELVVNLKAARALKLTIPPAFLVRADEVIQ